MDIHIILYLATLIMAAKNVEEIEEMDTSSIASVSDDTLRVNSDDDAHRVDTDDDISSGQQKDSSKTTDLEIAEKRFYKFLESAPESLKFDPEKAKKIYKDSTSIKILITGKTGSGKSTLVNGILGVAVTEDQKAMEGRSISEACTTIVKAYEVKKGNVNMTIWDSPGLQDGTDNEEYVKQMKEKCLDRDLTLYCIDVRQTRFLNGNNNLDVVAMKKLTKEFTSKFWSNTLIVLTFFNCVADDVNIKYLETEEKTKAVEARLQEWKNQIVEILVVDVKMDRKFAEKIIIVPTGYYREPHLPVCKYWLSNLWFHCLAAIPTKEAKAAFYKANEDRMKEDTDVKPKDLITKNIESQPIVVQRGGCILF